jgi:hypothetical protein
MNMLSEETSKKVKKKQKHISTNEDLSEYGYRIVKSNCKKIRWLNIEKQCEYLHEYYEANKEKYHDRWEKQYYVDINESRASSRLYYATHREEASNCKKKKYWFDHEETLRKRAETRQKNKKPLRVVYEKYYKEKSDEIIATGMEYSRTSKGKATKRKSDAKRNRDLGYHLIAKFNDYSVVSPTVFHHLDNENVIEIPKWIHLKSNSPKRGLHRERAMKYLKCFMNSEYYDVLDQDIFDKYANGEN